MQMQKASFPILLILAPLPAFFTGCRGYGTTGSGGLFGYLTPISSGLTEGNDQ
jgi:hypothetical protein